MKISPDVICIHVVSRPPNEEISFFRKISKLIKSNPKVISKPLILWNHDSHELKEHEKLRFDYIIMGDKNFESAVNELDFIYRKFVRRKPSIFVSHTWRDKPFVRKLAADLRRVGVYVWIDEAEMKVGDSLIAKISEGIENVDYVGVILSPQSVKSGWVRKELKIAMNQEIKQKRVKVLPLLVKECDLPRFLKGKLYADFSKPSNYHEALEKVLDAIGARTDISHNNG